jgi:hypothetical protein
VTLTPDALQVLCLWPRLSPKGVRLVWLNSGDEAPALPAGWSWHERHSCRAEALGALETEGWGELLVIMGAGTSIQDFTQLKQVSVILLKSTESKRRGADRRESRAFGVGDESQSADSLYPFEKDLLQVSADSDVFNEKGSMNEPLCFETLRFMAKLRKAFLEGAIPPFHQWCAGTRPECTFGFRAYS